MSKKILIPLLVFLLIASAYITTSPTLQSLFSNAQEEISVKGTISIYGCEKPQKVALVLCNDAACSQPLQIDSLGTISPQTIKLVDTNTDNTWIYQYTAPELNFNANASPYIQSVTAYFANGTHITNKPERNVAMLIAGEMTRDLSIDASEKCTCDIQATAYIKDEKGAFITELDGKEEFGVSNAYHISKNGDIPASQFKNGKVTVGPGTYRSLYSDKIYGKDAFASVKLYAPGWAVLKQECQSNGLLQACPVLASDYAMVADKLVYPNLFEKLRVGCNVDIQYGWVLKKKPRPVAKKKQTTPKTRDRIAALLSEREGYGQHVIGGTGGVEVVVTRPDDNPADPQEGSLRWAATLPFPAIITFNVKEPIVLEADIKVESFKTIDGRGSNVVITGKGGFTIGEKAIHNQIKPVEQVIITDITMKNQIKKSGGGCYGRGDAIGISYSHDIWIHHTTLSNYCDGLLDIVKGSHNVTASWNRFENHEKALLISSSEEDGNLDRNITVTLHHNYFFNNLVRQPRARFALVDMYNNYIHNWRAGATGYSLFSQFIIQNNIYEADVKKRATSVQEGGDKAPGSARASGNLELNGAIVRGYQPENVFQRPYSIKLDIANEDLKSKVKNLSGPRN